MQPAQKTITASGTSCRKMRPWPETHRRISLLKPHRAGRLCGNSTGGRSLRQKVSKPNSASFPAGFQNWQVRWNSDGCFLQLASTTPRPSPSFYRCLLRSSPAAGAPAENPPSEPPFPARRGLSCSSPPERLVSTRVIACRRKAGFHPGPIATTPRRAQFHPGQGTLWKASLRPTRWNAPPMRDGVEALPPLGGTGGLGRICPPCHDFGGLGSTPACVPWQEKAAEISPLPRFRTVPLKSRSDWSALACWRCRRTTPRPLTYCPSLRPKTDRNFWQPDTIPLEIRAPFQPRSQRRLRSPKPQAPDGMEAVPSVA